MERWHQLRVDRSRWWRWWWLGRIVLGKQPASPVHIFCRLPHGQPCPDLRSECSGSELGTRGASFRVRSGAYSFQTAPTISAAQHDELPDAEPEHDGERRDGYRSGLHAYALHDGSGTDGRTGKRQRYGLRFYQRKWNHNPGQETNGVIPKWTGTSSQGNSGLSDSGSQLTYAGSGPYNTFGPAVNLFAALPSCSTNEGQIAPVTDSSTNTVGATITGSGSNHVMAYCNGTNWTVGTACKQWDRLSNHHRLDLHCGKQHHYHHCRLDAHRTGTRGGYGNLKLLATGTVDGPAPVDITTGTTASLGGTFKSGYTFNQEATAATAVAYTLPTAAAGLQYCVGNSWNGSAATTGVPDRQHLSLGSSSSSSPMAP